VLVPLQVKSVLVMAITNWPALCEYTIHFNLLIMSDGSRHVMKYTGSRKPGSAELGLIRYKNW